ncbi:armadillo beta-catenin repeat family protein [Stylonychia lemnae]|uniref:Armadillo beta-catenin repeat family protein n=1 Tax=Stylonychia lemnae TaxID=5949 RepID=A0A078B965_STYLE|nr:armadillo beta-catenin repeat family protein [Stylonychia lemnae]|eukprot:CDW90103.1 armadillo beta-catenin repeat family protein [Stylonychia lemnae]
MVDWNGLFKWSINHQDGTKPSSFKVMSKEDRDWLESALKEFTFNDVDRMREICKDLGENHQTMSQEILLDHLEEILELVELHPRSGLNLCLCGGMKIVMEIMFDSKDKEARKLACSIFSFCVQNSKEVQTIVQKLGALNLMHQYIREELQSNKEAVIGALSQYLKGENFSGKMEFINDQSGLSFIKEALLACPQDQYRHSKKFLWVIYDFLLSDDQLNIENNPTFIRQYLSDDQILISRLIELLTLDSQSQENIFNHQLHERRDVILKILQYLVNQQKEQLLTQIQPTLNKLDQELKKGLLSQDQSKIEYLELLERELTLIKEVELAPSKKIKSNYEEIEFKPVIHLKDNEEEKKEEQKPLALGF